jgi:hypothetical protein
MKICIHTFSVGNTWQRGNFGFLSIGSAVATLLSLDHLAVTQWQRAKLLKTNACYRVTTCSHQKLIRSDSFRQSESV